MAFFLHNRTRSEERLAKLAKRIAERSYAEVIKRIDGMVPDMSPSEARGYIRARAALVVHREVNRALHRERRLKASERAKLITLVTEAIVEAVGDQNRMQRPIAA